MGDLTDSNTNAFPYGMGDRMGMTLRDWFAGQALAGQLANSSARCEGVGEFGIAIIFAKDAYALADAMLAARAEK